jgi:vitamin B12 transporter
VVGRAFCLSATTVAIGLPVAALAGVLLAASAPGSQLAAQEPEDTVALPVPQEPEDTVVFPVAGVTVTALRGLQPRSAVPLDVSVIEGDDLRARGIRSLAEALDDLPGVTVVETGSFGGTTSLFVRGGESDYVRVLVDGVPVNAPGGGLDLAHLGTDNVDRIEVVRGPSSVLYGSDAVAAVIEVHTRSGSGPPRVDARARAGSHGSVDLAASEMVRRARSRSRSLTGRPVPETLIPSSATRSS